MSTVSPPKSSCFRTIIFFQLFFFLRGSYLLKDGKYTLHENFLFVINLLTCFVILVFCTFILLFDNTFVLDPLINAIIFTRVISSRMKLWLYSNFFQNNGTSAFGKPH